MMKYNKTIAAAMAGLMAAAAYAGEHVQRGEILEGINMFAPDDSAPLYKQKANEQYGTQWYVDAAYGYWHLNGGAPEVNNHSNYLLLHAMLNQRVIEDSVNGGTWLRVELSGSWGLDRRSADTNLQFTDGVGESTGVHADIYGPHDLVLPEVSLMHYFNGKRACIIAGMVNMTNYFDAVGPANDSFSSFTNNAFVNSTVLGLPDANLGAIAQYELDTDSYAMIGFSRETTSYGYNPFRGGSSYMVVGEYGRTILDGDATLRINPFFRQVEEGDKNRKNAGLAASIEYAVCDEVTVFARSGFGAKQDLGAAFDFSCGAQIQGIPGREDDYLGVAFGVFKGTNTADEPTTNKREYVLEAYYSLQLNDYCKLMPHVQYIKNPAYSEESDAFAAGVQAVLSF